MAKGKKAAELALGEKVNILFHFGQQNGMAVDYRSVGAATGLSVNNLHKIRSGQNDNPGIKTVKQLGAYFDVPLGYFDNKTREQCWAYLKRHSERQIVAPAQAMRPIVLRSDELSEDGWRAIESMIKFVKRAEGLSDESEE